MRTPSSRRRMRSTMRRTRRRRCTIRRRAHTLLTTLLLLLELQLVRLRSSQLVVEAAVEVDRLAVNHQSEAVVEADHQVVPHLQCQALHNLEICSSLRHILLSSSAKHSLNSRSW